MTDSVTQPSLGRKNSGFEVDSFNREADSKASNIASSVEKTAHAAMDKGHEIAEAAGDKAAQARDILVAKIKDHPLSAIGAAIGIGVVFGLLRR